MADNIRVCVRFRPVRSTRKNLPNPYPVSYDEKENRVSIPSARESHKGNDFFFDEVFGPKNSQLDIFNRVGVPCCDHVIEGYNVTVFCYGQSGSGKTYSMFGPDEMFIDLNAILSEEHCGIVPRAAQYIFKKADSDPHTDTIVLKAGCLEVYMEKIKDLLDPHTGKKLRIVSTKQGAQVDGLLWKHVRTPEDLNQCVILAMQNRVTDSQKLNASSSRSHAIISLQVTITRMGQHKDTQGVIHFCDLAGSEKMKQTQAAVGSVIAKQGMAINKSLSLLGSVIKQLAAGKKYISYRDSVLTRCLQEALGGNSKTTLIVAASSHSESREETLSSMRFAKSCKMIKNKAKANKKENLSNLKAEIEKLNETIEKLEKENAQLYDFVREMTRSTPNENAGTPVGIEASGGLLENPRLMRGVSLRKIPENERMSVLHERTKTLKNKNRKVEEAKQALESEIHDLKREIHGLQYRNEQAEEKIADVIEENSKLICEKNEESKRLASSIERENKLKIEIRILEQEVESLKEHIEIIENSRAALAKSVASNLDGMKGEWASQVKTLQQQLEEQDQFHIAESEKLSNEKKDAQRRLMELESKLSAEKKKFVDLEKTIGAMKLEREELLTEHQSSSTEMQNMIDELTEEISKQQEAYRNQLSQTQRANPLPKVDESVEDNKMTFLSPTLKNTVVLPSVTKPRMSLLDIRPSISRTVSKRNLFTFGDTQKNAIRRKAMHMAEVVAFHDQLADENISKDIAAREQREYEKEVAKRQRQEEEELKYSQWLKKRRKRSPRKNLREIPEEIRKLLKILRIEREFTAEEYARLSEYHEEQEKIREEEENRKKIDRQIQNKTLRTFQEAEFQDGPVAKPDDQFVFLKDLTPRQLVELNMEISPDFKEDDILSDDASSSTISDEFILEKLQSAKSARLPVSKSRLQKNRSLNVKMTRSANINPRENESSPEHEYLSRQNKDDLLVLSKKKAGGSRRRKKQRSRMRIKYSKYMKKVKECEANLDRMTAEIKNVDSGQAMENLKKGIRKQQRKLDKLMKSRREFFGFFNPRFRMGVRLVIKKGLCQVAAVNEDGQLYNIGVRAGDIVIHVNQMSVSKPEDFANSINLMRSKETRRATLGWRKPREEDNRTQTMKNVKDELRPEGKHRRRRSGDSRSRSHSSSRGALRLKQRHTDTMSRSRSKSRGVMSRERRYTDTNDRLSFKQRQYSRSISPYIRQRTSGKKKATDEFFAHAKEC